MTERPDLRRTRWLVAAVVCTAAVAIAVAGCGGASDATTGTGSSGASSGGSGAGGTSSASSATRASAQTQLALVGYSTPKPAYDALTAAFARTPGGRAVGFSESFGASGAQSRAVDSGQPADVVAFSTTPDMTRLVDDKLVAPDWDVNPERGMSSDSVVVFVVRKGNPKHITGWSDLIKPGVDVITPNPATSGSARWNILAGYGAQLKLGRSRAQALAYTRTLLTKHVSVQDSSAAAALQTFTSGKGDVLLDYESNAIAAQRAGDAISYVIPRQTLEIQTPIAITAHSSHPAQARAFLRYQWSTAGQTIWAKQGYRPVRPAVAKRFAKRFPTPPQLFQIGYLGGWTKVSSEFFDPAHGSIIAIERAAGVPTASK